MDMQNKNRGLRNGTPEKQKIRQHFQVTRTQQQIPFDDYIKSQFVVDIFSRR